MDNLDRSAQDSDPQNMENPDPNDIDDWDAYAIGEPTELPPRRVPGPITDRRINFHLAPGDVMVECPYDRNHLVREARLSIHLNKCRLNYKIACMRRNRTVDIGICKYQWTHHMHVTELAAHELTCPGKNLGWNHYPEPDSHLPPLSHSRRDGPSTSAAVSATATSAARSTASSDTATSAARSTAASATATSAAKAGTSVATSAGISAGFWTLPWPYHFSGSGNRPAAAAGSAETAQIASSPSNTAEASEAPTTAAAASGNAGNAVEQEESWDDCEIEYGPDEAFCPMYQLTFAPFRPVPPGLPRSMRRAYRREQQKNFAEMVRARGKDTYYIPEFWDEEEFPAPAPAPTPESAPAVNTNTPTEPYDPDNPIPPNFDDLED